MTMKNKKIKKLCQVLRNILFVFVLVSYNNMKNKTNKQKSVKKIFNNDTCLLCNHQVKT